MKSRMQRWDAEEVVKVLLECAGIALRIYERPRVEVKEDRSLVTDADRAVEQRLGELFDRPAEGSHLIGEETAASRSEEYIQAALRGVAWVVDPIDGTAPYAHHLPTWGISIGLLRRGVLEEGAVYLPVSREMLVSEGRRVRYGTTAAERPAGGGDFTFTDVTGRPARYTPSGMIGISQGMAKRGRLDLPNPVQALGSAVMSLAYLCLGRYLGYVGRLKLWDLAGGLPLLLRCGAKVRLHGGPWLDGAVTPEVYDLEPGSPGRWKLRREAVFAPSEEVALRLCRALDLE